METKRNIFCIENTTTYKGIAIIFVILSHIPRIFEKINLSILNPLGYFGVAIFLFTSGYGLQKSAESGGTDHFWINRIKRIMPTVTVVTLFIVGMNILLDKPNCNTFLVLLSCLGLSNSVNSVTWYLGMMWFCYSGFYLLKRTKIDELMGSILISIAILVLSIALGDTPLNMWGLNAFSFSFGLVTARYTKIEIWLTKNKTKIFSVFVFFILFILYYFILGNDNWLPLRNPSKSLISLSFLVAFFSVLPDLLSHIKWLYAFSYLGDISFELFMIHAPFIFIWRSFFLIQNKFIMILIFIAVSIILSELIKRIVHFTMKRIGGSA